MFFHELVPLHASGLDVVSINAGFGPISLEEHLTMIEGLASRIDTDGNGSLLDIPCYL